MLLKVSANPLTRSCSLLLMLSRPSGIRTEIFDLEGRLAHQEHFPDLPAGEQACNLSDIRFRAGNYIIRIYTNQGILSSMLNYHP